MINAGVGDLNRTRQMGILDNNAHAVAAHAFGGTRGEVANSLTNDSFARAVSDFVAQQRSAGFNNASNMAMQNYQTQYNDPFLKQGILNQTFGGSVLPTATNTNRTSTSPGIAGILGGVGSLAQGVGMFL